MRREIEKFISEIEGPVIVCTDEICAGNGDSIEQCALFSLIVATLKGFIDVDLLKNAFKIGLEDDLDAIEDVSTETIEKEIEKDIERLQKLLKTTKKLKKEVY